MEALRNLEPEATRHLGGQTLRLHTCVDAVLSYRSSLYTSFSFVLLYCIIDWGGFQSVDRRKKLGQIWCL